MKIAFIHNEQKIATGAHYINDLIAQKLRSRGIEVINFYPTNKLIDYPVHLKGLANILFFILSLNLKMKSLNVTLFKELLIHQ